MGRALRRHDITLLVFLREGPNKSGLLFLTVLLLCVFLGLRRRRLRVVPKACRSEISGIVSHSTILVRVARSVMQRQRNTAYAAEQQDAAGKQETGSLLRFTVAFDCSENTESGEHLQSDPYSSGGAPTCQWRGEVSWLEVGSGTYRSMRRRYCFAPMASLAVPGRHCSPTLS